MGRWRKGEAEIEKLLRTGDLDQVRVDDTSATRLLDAGAAVNGRPIQEILRLHPIEFAEQPDNSALIERIRARKSRSAAQATTNDILEALEADRRRSSWT